MHVQNNIQEEINSTHECVVYGCENRTPEDSMCSRCFMGVMTGEVIWDPRRKRQSKAEHVEGEWAVYVSSGPMHEFINQYPSYREATKAASSYERNRNTLCSVVLVDIKGDVDNG